MNCVHCYYSLWNYIEVTQNNQIRKKMQFTITEKIYKILSMQTVPFHSAWKMWLFTYADTEANF